MTRSDVPEISLFGDFGLASPEILIVGFIVLLHFYFVIWLIRTVTVKCENCKKRVSKSGGFCSRCGGNLSEKTPAGTQDND